MRTNTTVSRTIDSMGVSSAKKRQTAGFFVGMVIAVVRAHPMKNAATLRKVIVYLFNSVGRWEESVLLSKRSTCHDSDVTFANTNSRNKRRQGTSLAPTLYGSV